MTGIVDINGHEYRVLYGNCDSIEIDGQSWLTGEEPVVKVVSEGGYCWGAVPMLDVIKCAMREHPELILRAKQEIAMEALEPADDTFEP